MAQWLTVREYPRNYILVQDLDEWTRILQEARTAVRVHLQRNPIDLYLDELGKLLSGFLLRTCRLRLPGRFIPLTTAPTARRIRHSG